MKDRFGRAITYLRVSITDRCNLRCRYCMPAGPPNPARPAPAVLSLEETARVVRTAVEMGIRKVRITGGEPLLRDGVTEFVRTLSRIRGVEDLAMSTNGTLLRDFAPALADAGLVRVNVSLDTLDPARFRRITGGGDLRRVLEGIEAARKAGLEPIKLNCVVKERPDEPDARSVARFARENGFEARFIPMMDLGAGKFSKVIGGTGGDCARCNRLRLSSDGRVRPCLFSDTSFDVLALGTKEALRRAVLHKPRSGEPCRLPTVGIIGG